MRKYNYQPLDRGMSREQFKALRLGFRIANSAVLKRIVEGKRPHPAKTGSSLVYWNSACDDAMAAIAVAFPAELRNTIPPFRVGKVDLAAAKARHGTIGFAVKINMSLDSAYLNANRLCQIELAKKGSKND